jgi:hypothetical protein
MTMAKKGDEPFFLFDPQDRRRSRGRGSLPKPTGANLLIEFSCRQKK